MAGNDDDKDKEPKPKPSTEAGAGDASREGSGKVPPSPEGQGKVQGKKPSSLQHTIYTMKPRTYCRLDASRSRHPAKMHWIAGRGDIVFTFGHSFHGHVSSQDTVLHAPAKLQHQKQKQSRAR